MTWPLAARLGAQIPADVGNDVWVHEWNFYWLKQALFTGQNPYFTPLLFHPTGVELTSHNIAWFNFALWFPLQALWGSNTAFSLMYPFLFTLNAYAMYLFAYTQLRAWTGALIAGLIYSFWPYVLSHSPGHPNMLTLFGLPLGLLYLHYALKEGHRRHAVMAGFFLALLGISRWQLLVPAFYVVALFVLYTILAQRTCWTLHTAMQLILTGVVMLLLMAPFAAPLVITQVTRGETAELLTYEPQYASDLLSYFLPHAHLSLWSALVAHLPDRLQFPQQEITFVGYTVLILVMVGLYGRRRKALLWLAAMLLLGLLALGPVITIGQQPFPALPTPYRLVEDWFVNRLLRRPDRFNVFLGLPVGMLAGLGMTFLRAQLPGKRFVPLALLLSCCILGEYSQMPYHLTTTEVPRWYQQLAKEPGPFAIVGIPISPYYADKYYMHYQIQHGKPMVGGHVSRRPPEVLAYMDGSTFLDEMLARRVMNPDVGDVSHQLHYLAAANVRYLILHKDFSTAEQIELWKAWLVVNPQYEDEDVVVYSTAPRLGVDFTLEQQVTSQIGLIRSTAAPSHGQQGELVTIDVGWTAQGPVAVDYTGCIRFLNSQQVVKQKNCTLLSPNWPTSRWGADEVVRGQFIVQIDPHLPPGEYQIELLLKEATGEIAGQPTIIGTLTVAELQRTFEAPTLQHVTNLNLGNTIALLGYDLTVADTVRLTLYWQARQPIQQSYKVFVHLVDQASGAILAQTDAPPRQWRYPTTWWAVGEVVQETIELPYDQTTTAVRSLRLGMYDEETGERLPMQSQRGARYTDNALLIPIDPP